MGTPQYPRPVVPDFLISLNADNLPFQDVYYIRPGDTDDLDEPPSVFVDEDRNLLLANGHEFDDDDRFPASPLGKIGVMKVMYAVDGTSTPHTAFLADLRFLFNNQLARLGDMKRGIADQEDFMHFATFLEDCVTFEGLIIPDEELDIDEELPKGELYGDKLLFDALKKLRKQGNKRFKKFREREAREIARNNQQTKQKERATPAPDKPVPSAKDTKDLKVVFSNG